MVIFIDQPGLIDPPLIDLQLWGKFSCLLIQGYLEALEVLSGSSEVVRDTSCPWRRPAWSSLKGLLVQDPFGVSNDKRRSSNGPVQNHPNVHTFRSDSQSLPTHTPSSHTHTHSCRFTSHVTVMDSLFTPTLQMSPNYWLITMWSAQ